MEERKKIEPFPMIGDGSPQSIASHLTSIRVFTLNNEKLQVGLYFGYLQWHLSEVVAAFGGCVSDTLRDSIADYDQVALTRQCTDEEFYSWVVWAEAEVLPHYLQQMDASDLAKYKRAARHIKSKQRRQKPKPT